MKHSMENSWPLNQCTPGVKHACDPGLQTPSQMVIVNIHVGNQDKVYNIMKVNDLARSHGTGLRPPNSR